MTMITLEQLTKKADTMRDCLTFSENRAYESLLNGPAFEMQVVFGFYILDFFIPSKLLVIEIDGESHLQQEEHDKRRDLFCQRYGLSVLRIPNRLANTALTQALSFPDAKNYQSVWKVAKTRAAKQQAKKEQKAICLLSAEEKEKRKERYLITAERKACNRALKLAAVKALPLGATAKEVKDAIRAAVPKPLKGKKKREAENNTSDGFLRVNGISNPRIGRFYRDRLAQLKAQAI